jgi:hypothetical protein
VSVFAVRNCSPTFPFCCVWCVVRGNGVGVVGLEYRICHGMSHLEHVLSFAVSICDVGLWSVLGFFPVGVLAP